MGEWRTYHLNQFVEQLERWMPEEAWEACSGDVVFERRLPTYVCVRNAHDHRAAAVAAARRQGNKVALRVRTFPKHALPDGEYVAAEPIETYFLSLRERYPAPVTAEVTYHAGGRLHRVPRIGPEISHHGAFFEPSRQRLAKQRLVLLDVPSTPERIGPAAAALMQPSHGAGAGSRRQRRTWHSDWPNRRQGDAGGMVGQLRHGRDDCRGPSRNAHRSKGSDGAAAAVTTVENRLMAEPSRIQPRSKVGSKATS